MLSICIPVYNFDVTPLVDELLRQASEITYPVEILVFDDYSQSYYRKKNSQLEPRPHVTYLEFDFNIGRSKIRNRLADLAHGQWLLYLDCDTVPESPNFLRNYVEQLGKAPVIYGGLTYGPRPTAHKELMLRWKYGVRRECLKARFRQIKAYKSFKSSNFVVERETFRGIRFNELLSGYGHEDTLLGIEFEKHDVKILHIDNPAVHLGLDSCTVFIEKSTQAIHNLARILQMLPESQKKIEKSIKLLNVFRIARFTGMTYPLRAILRVFKPIIKKQLAGKEPSVTLFDMYKLSLLMKLYRKGWSKITV